MIVSEVSLAPSMTGPIDIKGKANVNKDLAINLLNNAVTAAVRKAHPTLEFVLQNSEKIDVRQPKTYFNIVWACLERS